MAINTYFTKEGQVVPPMKVYRQTTEPTLDVTDKMCIWVDTDDSDKAYLVYRRGSADQVKTVLTTSGGAYIADNSSTQKVKVDKAGTLIGTRQEINLIEGSNVTLTVADNAGSDRVDVTIASSGGGSGSGSLIYKGDITANDQFPTAAEVQLGWFYRIMNSNIVDDDETKTNTGQAFSLYQNIYWDAYSTWTVFVQETYVTATPTEHAIGGIEVGDTFWGYNGEGLTMTEMWDKLLYPYKYPIFSTFNITGQETTVEVGSSIAIDSTFNWATTNTSNVAFNSVSLIDVTGGNIEIANSLSHTGTRATSYPASPITKNSPQTYIFQAKGGLSGGGHEGQFFYGTFTVQWQWRRFYGESTEEELDEAGIEALRVGGLSGNFVGTYAFSAGGYKYLCYPATFAAATSFKDESTNLDVPFETLANVSVTNGYSQTTNYRVYRSTNIMGSAMNIIVA